VSTSAAVLLLDDASGEVLFERNGHTPLPPASLTKVATAIIAIERGNLDEIVETDIDSRTMRGSSVMGLQPGDRFTLRDLLYGLMLPSGNDAAIAIARHVAGSDGAFVGEMNALLRRLGLKESSFSNPHGLSASGHYASAYDLAMLSRYALTLPVYREIAAADRWVARGSREIAMDSFVTDARWKIPGGDAAKSGYTRSAGRTLVVSAERDGHRMHAVVLNEPYTEAVAGALIDWGFANFDWTRPAVSSSATTAALAASGASVADIVSEVEASPVNE
jgi:D-alanyl-D-alanine carboxypeptidase